MNNRLHNCTNPHQGVTKKVLCVCSAGLLRSPTAAVVLNREYDYNTRACGVDKGHALIPIDDVLCEWADEVVVMEKWMADYVDQGFQNKVKVLGVPDRFAYMDPLLQKAILDAYKLQTMITEVLHEDTVS